MQRTDLMDTAPWAHELQVKLLREKSPEWRLNKAFELCAFGREIWCATMAPEDKARAIERRRNSLKVRTYR